MSRRATYANVVSTLALVIAVGGGGAYAAALAKNSVTSKQIKNGAVKAVDLKKGSVGGAQVKDGSLGGADVDESTLVLPATPAVAEGPFAAGDLPGEPGSPGPIATVTWTAPANGFVKVTGSASLGALPTSYYVSGSLTQDGQEIANVYLDAGDADSFIDQRQSVQAVAPVTAGSHTWSLVAYEDVSSGVAGSDYAQAQVVVEFFPVGSAPFSPARGGAGQ